MKTVEVVQVIKTALTTRGDGKDDPLRFITQYWSMDGDFMWEYDPTQPIEDPRLRLSKL